MSEFCKNERHGGICVKTGTYCNLGACPYEQLEQFAPVVHCRDCKHFNHKRMECENEAVSTDHEGGAQYSLNFWLDDFCSYGERKEGGADNGV